MLQHVHLILIVCHRPDGLEEQAAAAKAAAVVCHRPDGLEDIHIEWNFDTLVCHRPDGLEVNK